MSGTLHFDPFTSFQGFSDPPSKEEKEESHTSKAMQIQEEKEVAFLIF